MKRASLNLCMQFLLNNDSDIGQVLIYTFTLLWCVQSVIFENNMFDLQFLKLDYVEFCVLLKKTNILYMIYALFVRFKENGRLV